MKYNPSRSKKLIRWASKWPYFEAKELDPEEPSIGMLSEELGEQLNAAGIEIERLLSLLPVKQRLIEFRRINGIED